MSASYLIMVCGIGALLLTFGAYAARKARWTDKASADYKPWGGPAVTVMQASESLNAFPLTNNTRTP